MDATRSAAALAYMQSKVSLVDAYSGSADAENELLKMLVNNTPSSSAGVLGDAYLKTIDASVVTVADRNEAYKLNHAIMFATNFGRHTITLPSGYGDLLDSLVVEYAADTDVLGELLISAKCIGYWSETLSNAYNTFRTAWDTLDRSSALFNQNYHPILVGGLLFSMG